MKKVFAEIGLGNGSFLSTEYEEDGKEFRIAKFVLPERNRNVYLRFWFGKTVYVFSLRDGFEITKKDAKKIKLLFGVSGESR